MIIYYLQIIVLIQIFVLLYCYNEVVVLKLKEKHYYSLYHTLSCTCVSWTQQERKKGKKKKHI